MRPKHLPWVIAAGVTLVLVASVWEPLLRSSGAFNLYAHQSQAWLEGRLDVGEPFYDVSIFNSRYYVGFPPFPSLILLPFVALLGVQGTNVMLIAIVLSAVSAFALTRVLQLISVETSLASWVAAAFFFGSPYWLAVRLSTGVWYFAHVVSVTCLLLAVYVALRTGWGWLVGLLVGLSFLTRQLTIFAGVFALLVLWQHPALSARRGKIIHICGFVAMLALCAAVYLLFNKARFGNPFDTGYAYLDLQGVLKARVERFGLFDVAYVPFNLYYFFLQGFHLEFAPPEMLVPTGVDPFGTALIFASPFVFAALFAQWRKPFVWSAWLSIALIFAPQLFYYNNGSAQWNAQRFTLDFWPVLILLIALGAQRLRSYLQQWVWRATVIFAIGLNVIVWSLTRGL